MQYESSSQSFGAVITVDCHNLNLNRHLFHNVTLPKQTVTIFFLPLTKTAVLSTRLLCCAQVFPDSSFSSFPRSDQTVLHS